MPKNKNMFLLIIDSFTGELKKRRIQQVSRQVLLLQLYENKKGQGIKEKATNLYHTYTHDLDSDFFEECIHFQTYYIAGAGIEHPAEKSFQGI